MSKTIVYIKHKKRKAGEFQFFMHQFVESAIRNGISPLKEVDCNNRLYNYLIKILKRLPLISLKRKKRAVIVPSQADSLYMSCFPYLYNSEIIPMLWDLWPHTWNSLYRDLEKIDSRICFCTVRTMAQKIEKDLGIKCYWIPEGIDIADYDSGYDLLERPIDIYELGRQHKEYHKVILELIDKGVIKSYKGNSYDESGKLLSLAFDTAEDLLLAINTIKIVVCFPQVDTHPQRAGGLETLTQRYWEAMLSRNIVIGRAPQELIDLIGYNPVIDVDWENPQEQLETILGNIESYQKIVDKNYEVALKRASWSDRINLLKDYLLLDDYCLIKS